MKVIIEKNINEEKNNNKKLSDYNNLNFISNKLVNIHAIDKKDVKNEINNDKIKSNNNNLIDKTNIEKNNNNESK